MLFTNLFMHDASQRGCFLAVQDYLVEYLRRQVFSKCGSCCAIIVHLLVVFLSRDVILYYRKFPKYSDTQKICCNHSKIWTMWLYHRVMSPNDADAMANSVDPDQTAPLGAVWSGSALFAQAYLSENLGSLRYLPWWCERGQRKIALVYTLQL